MRQTAARLNRAWLTIIGLALLLAGVVVGMLSTGLWPRALDAAGIDLDGATRSDPVADAGTGDVFTSVWVVLLIAVVGLLVALLAARWLVAQVPRTNPAKPFRLHDDVDTGLTRCAPKVLTDVVKAQAEALRGVNNCSAVLRGTASQPDLTVKVSVSDRTSIRQVLDALQNQIAADLGQALDTRLRRLGVQVEVDTSKPRTDRITI